MAPRILFLSPRLPFPLNSGTKIRISHLLRAMTELGKVDFLCYGQPQEIRDLETRLHELPPWWDKLNSIRIVPQPFWPQADLSALRAFTWRNLRQKDSLFYTSFPANPLLSMCTQEANGADLIWAERLYVAHALGPHAGKTVVDLDDLESVKLAREAETTSSRRSRMRYLNEVSRMASLERGAAARYLLTTVCSNGDLNHLGASGNRISVVPNGVDDDLFNLAPQHREENRLVFVGTLHYGPNIDALQYFCNEIFPLILAQHPSTVLDIVGLKPSEEVLALSDGKQIFIHADVPDVAPYVQRATLSIVPIRIGGGTRLKILESLALGTPVVSTTVGAEGLELDHERHLRLADDPVNFAAAVSGLLAAPLRARQLAEAGFERVKERYLWSTIRKRVAQLCEELLNSRMQSETR